MRKLFAVCVLPAAIMLAGCQQDDAKLETNVDKMSYGIGLSMGRSVKNQPIEVNADAIIVGLQDALAEKDQRIDEETIRTAFAAVRDEAMAKQAKEAEENIQKGKDFLAENAKKEGVVTTASGLQYQVLTEGKGDMPKADDTVTVNYHGTLTDNTVFDSSVDRGEPATFRVNQVIPGWTEALQLMKVGEKVRLYIPSELAYGDRSPSPKIPGNSVLIFEVELLSIAKG